MNNIAAHSFSSDVYSHHAQAWGAELSFPNTRRIQQVSHRIFNRYPARSICLVPRSILYGFPNAPKGRRLRVLDPFMGSGTTAVEAQLFGFEPLAVEIDPFARMIANVRTTAFDAKARGALVRIFEKASEGFKTLEPDPDLLPTTEGIDYWFRKKEMNEILALKTAIFKYTKAKSADRDFFLIVLADMIRPCSKAERQSLKPYISTKYEKKVADVKDAFHKSFTAHYSAVEEFEHLAAYKRLPITWLGRDATNFDSYRPFADVAITSPPYINALDYVRCIKLESAWIGTGTDSIFRTVRESQVGESVRSRHAVPTIVDDAAAPIFEEIANIDPKRASTVRAYFADMLRNLIEVRKTLRKGGEYHIIVGNSVIRGVKVNTHEIIAELGSQVGMNWVQYYKYRIKDHRTSIPRKGQGGKIDFEHVISLRKG